MANPVNYLPNEVALKKVFAGTEATYGAGGTPTFSLYGALAINKQKPLVRNSDEYRGSYARMRNPRRGPTTIDGTFAKRLSFEDLDILKRYFLKKGGGTRTDDANTVHGYTSPALANDGAIDSFMAEHFVDGMPFVANGIQMNQIVLSGDVDDSEADWNLSADLLVQSNDLKTVTSLTFTGGSTSTAIKSGAGWTTNEHAGKFLAMRSGTANNIASIVKILSNDATTLTFDPSTPLPAAVANADVGELSGLFTTGITDRNVEYIPAEATQLFIADAYGSWGSANEIKDKLISWSITIQHNFGRKRFQGNVGTYSKKRRRGDRLVTAQFVMEFDDWYEYKKWDVSIPSDRAVRLQCIGSTIDSGASSTKLAQLDLPRVQWDEVNPNNDRDGNITAVYQAVAYVDDTYGAEFGITTKTKLATLP